MFKNKKGEELSILEYGKALAKAELLQEENDRLRAQVDRLQEALVAATAPRAYEQIQADKAGAIELQPSEAELKRRAAREKEEEFLKEYVDSMEKPTFLDADDLISSLGKLVGVNISDVPVQANNQES